MRISGVERFIVVDLQEGILDQPHLLMHIPHFEACKAPSNTLSSSEMPEIMQQGKVVPPIL